MLYCCTAKTLRAKRGFPVFFAEPIEIVGLPAGARLHAAMALGNRLGTLEFPFESRIVHEHFNLFMHRRLISLERNDVTGATLHDFADDFLLTARRVFGGLRPKCVSSTALQQYSVQLDKDGKFHLAGCCDVVLLYC